MVYTSVSMEKAIGKAIRDSRVQDSAYIIDMHAWMPEVLKLIRFEAPLEGFFEDVRIVFHKGRMPCGLLYIDAVEHCGHRLPEGNSVKNIRTSQHTGDYITQPEVWTSGVAKSPTPDGNGIYFGTLTKVNALPLSTHYYQLELDHILTSFSDGVVMVYCQRLAHDGRGFPLIPDNQALLECLYWYTRMKMIGAGWEDPVFKYTDCEVRFNDYLGKASGEIDFPSPDQMEHRVNTFARFIPPENYYQNYFRVTSPEPVFDPMATRDRHYT